MKLYRERGRHRKGGEAAAAKRSPRAAASRSGESPTPQDGVGDLGDLHHFGDIVDPHDVRAAKN